MPIQHRPLCLYYDVEQIKDVFLLASLARRLELSKKAAATLTAEGGYTGKEVRALLLGRQGRAVSLQNLHGTRLVSGERELRPVRARRVTPTVSTARCCRNRTRASTMA